jgi:hypothetical protein
MLSLKKWAPLDPQVRGDQVELILRTHKTHEKKDTICINTVSGDVHIVDPQKGTSAAILYYSPHR